MWRMLLVGLVVGLGAAGVRAQASPPTAESAGLKDFKGYPLAVWLQDPQNALKYKAVGINLYLALYKGPTEGQLTVLQKAGMPVICDQNEEALKPKWKGLVLGFMHGDEPDNAQEKPGGGYGPPILPETIVAGYKKMKAADSRPVMLNLDLAVAYDPWVGRGTRSNHPEDYPEYVKGCDIVSFDIYPVTEGIKAISGKLWYVGRGVSRLREWAQPRPVWTCIECTHINNVKVKPTVEQVRSEVWMAIIHGARGLVYFCHQFKPFIEAGMLADQDMADGIKDINAQVQELAGPILEGQEIKDAKVASEEKDGIKFMARRWKGDTYVFAVGMSDQTRTATFTIPGLTATAVEVLDETQGVPVKGGSWTQEFKGYQVRLYRIKGAAR